jgi:hypothetical protein
MVFRVYCDGNEKWGSEPVTGPGNPQPCKINVAGVSTLKLEVQIDGDHRGAHAAWIEPRLLK